MRCTYGEDGIIVVYNLQLSIPSYFWHFNYKYYKYLLNVSSALDILSSEDGVLPCIQVHSSLIWFLEAEVLTAMYDILIKGNIHGVVLTSTLDDWDIQWLATFEFPPAVREKNLWLHIDAFDRPESTRQILTALYSPLGSHSNTPTITVDTALVDDFTAERLPKYELPNDLLVTYKSRVAAIIPEGSRVFLTVLQNACLADRELNWKKGNHFLALRDELTAEILKQSGRRGGSFTTISHVASLLIFRNWLGENRDVAHTRFHTSIQPRLAEWSVYNLSIHAGWVIQTCHEPKNVPSWIKYSSGSTTYIDRASIIPEVQ